LDFWACLEAIDPLILRMAALPGAGAPMCLCLIGYFGLGGPLRSVRETVAISGVDGSTHDPFF
jgi:hypothetical protein